MKRVRTARIREDLPVLAEGSAAEEDRKLSRNVGRGYEDVANLDTNL